MTVIYKLLWLAAILYHIVYCESVSDGRICFSSELKPKKFASGKDCLMTENIRPILRSQPFVHLQLFVFGEMYKITEKNKKNRPSNSSSH